MKEFEVEKMINFKVGDFQKRNNKAVRVFTAMTKTERSG